MGGWVGGWVGGLVGWLGRGEKGGLIELLYAWVVGGWVDDLCIVHLGR